MRIARIQTIEGETVAYGDGNDWVTVTGVDEALEHDGLERIPTSAVQLLAPVRPTVVVGVAHDHSAVSPPESITLFLKSARTVVGYGAAVVPARDSGRVDIEAELALVIKSECRDLTHESAMDAVLGYTIGFDATHAAHVQDPGRVRPKNGTGFTVLGPWIETELSDPDDLVIRVWVDGEKVADTSTSLLHASMAEILIEVSRWVELGPGDVILTGAPGTCFTVESGSLFEAEIEGIGRLSATRA